MISMDEQDTIFMILMDEQDFNKAQLNF